VEAKAAVVEAKAAVVEAKAAVVEVKPAVVDTKAPPPAKAGAAERTETFVRRKTSEAAVSPRAVTATVPLLSAVSGLNEGVTTFRIEQRDHVYMFGRTRRCEFRVQTAEVSREHATFTHRSDGIYVNDLGSVNGVLVNNTKVSEFRLYDGDLITVGRVKLRLFDPTETGRRGTDSVSSTPSRLAPPEGEHHHHPEAPPPERSTTFRSELQSHPRADLHPAIAGALAHDGGPEAGYRQRRPSVRVRLAESWQGSSRVRYGIVIIAAALLAIVAVTVGFRLAG
jgi:pSer/pThr/pTyr-binding forkhead associated (FHA) protein